MFSVRPNDLDISVRVATQAEMHASVAGRQIAARRARVGPLLPDSHLCSRTIPVTPRSYQLQRDPMIAVRMSAQHERPASENRNGRIHRSIVVQISESSAAARDGGERTKLGTLEFTGNVAEQRRR